MKDIYTPSSVNMAKANARHNFGLKLAFYGTAFVLTFNAGINYGINKMKKDILVPQNKSASATDSSSIKLQSINF